MGTAPEARMREFYCGAANDRSSRWPDTLFSEQIFMLQLIAFPQLTVGRFIHAKWFRVCSWMFYALMNSWQAGMRSDVVKEDQGIKYISRRRSL